MTASALIARLHAFAAFALEHGETEFSHVLVTWADAPEPITFETAWGVAAGVRGRARMEDRDAYLRDMGRVYFSGISVRKQAAAVLRACRQYEAAAWPQDRRLGRRPAGLSGAAFDILRCGGVPNSEQLRKILGKR